MAMLQEGRVGSEPEGSHDSILAAKMNPDRKRVEGRRARSVAARNEAWPWRKGVLR